MNCLLQVIDTLLILNNTIKWGNLCKIEPSKVIIILNNYQKKHAKDSKETEKLNTNIQIGSQNDGGNKHENLKDHKNDDQKEKGYGDKNKLLNEKERNDRNIRSVSSSQQKMTENSTIIIIQRHVEPLNFCA